MLAAGLLLLAAFWVVEHRVESPIVDFGLFRNGPYLGASAAAFALVGAYWVVIFFQPQYLQEILDHGPVAAGVLVLPITAPMVFISPFCGPLIDRFGPRGLMTVGMLCGAVGLALLTRIDASSSYGALLPGYLLFGISLGLVYAPMSTAAMLAMPRAKAGIAAGVLAMIRVTAGAVALAVVTAVFQSIEDDRLEQHPGDAAGAFATALGDSTWVLVGLVSVGAVLTWALVRRTEGWAPRARGAPRAQARAPPAPPLGPRSEAGGESSRPSPLRGRAAERRRARHGGRLRGRRSDARAPLRPPDRRSLPRPAGAERLRRAAALRLQPPGPDAARPRASRRPGNRRAAGGPRVRRAHRSRAAGAGALGAHQRGRPAARLRGRRG